ncbi:neprilysin-11-like protein [Leptotrombidium deliense]|uniref:Neprilysin-11-like protein n=1 Tax=Leptotrombidium deliense TaxID=299467 RepID=A0A443SAM7_9ACAR|nr:neprilysin-11-like protein [Leptotrombidium deliense]
MERQHGKESTLPGLGEYNQDQLFWIQLASIWCSRIRLEDLVQQIMTDPHSPLLFRVNGAFSNLLQFSKSFNCPLGSKMNPVNKCSIW